MDLIDSEYTPDPEETHLGTPAATLTLFLAMASLPVGMMHGAMVGVLVFASCLCVVGIDVMRNWNSKLRKERVLDIHQYRSALIAAVGLVFILLFPVYSLTGSVRAAMVLPTLVAIAYTKLLKLVAFWGLDDPRIEPDPETNVVRAWATEREFIDRVEEVALERAASDE